MLLQPGLVGILLDATKAAYSAVPFSMARPFPHSRTIRGGPVKARNMMTMRALLGSCRCACVSTPEPVRSMYQKEVGEGMPKVLPPLGEMLMWPLGERGAVPLGWC